MMPNAYIFFMREESMIKYDMQLESTLYNRFNQWSSVQIISTYLLLCSLKSIYLLSFSSLHSKCLLEQVNHAPILLTNLKAQWLEVILKVKWHINLYPRKHEQHAILITKVGT